MGLLRILSLSLAYGALANEEGKFEEYHSVAMKSPNQVTSPVGLKPIGFCYRMHSEGSHQFTEDSFTEIMGNFFHDLLTVKTAYFPVLCMTPAKKALLGDSLNLPHVEFVRTLYTLSDTLIRSMISEVDGVEILKAGVEFPTVNMYETYEMITEEKDTPFGKQSAFCYCYYFSVFNKQLNIFRPQPVKPIALRVSLVLKTLPCAMTRRLRFLGKLPRKHGG
jgi:hypothetical protein